MTHSQRQVGAFSVRIDRTLCVGFGDCIDELPALFELDAEGIVRFLDGAPDPPPAGLLAACRACPVDALTLLDAAGREVVP